MSKISEKKSLYIETSVISYLTAKSTRDLIITARQQITRIWWKQINLRFEPYISAYVIDEISRGDAEAAKNRLGSVKAFNLLPTSNEIDNLAKHYFKKIKIPEHAI